MISAISPSRALQLIGGVGIVVASFLDWASSGFATANGWDVGMLGLWQSIIGVIIAAIGLIGMTTHSSSLPKQVFGFEFEQAIIVLAFPVLLWNFGLQFDEVYGGLGLFIGWIAAALAIAGAWHEARSLQDA